jgi:hypothetical protein
LIAITALGAIFTFTTIASFVIWHTFTTSTTLMVIAGIHL